MRLERTEFVVEWIDAEDLLQAAEKAIRKASRLGEEGGQPPLNVKAEMDQGIADWAEPEASIRTRRFPSLAMAKGWATKNRKRDWYSEPRVFVVQITPTSPWPLEESETVEEWRFDGGDVLVACDP
jgi:hypothetical protein